MFYLVGIFTPSNWGDVISSDPRELLRGSGGGVRSVTWMFAANKGQVVWTSKVLLWIKENQMSRVKEFRAFLCMGRRRSLGSLRSFLSHASQLSGASILCFFPVLTLGSSYSLVAAGSRYCSSSWVAWRAGIPDDRDILVYWYGRKYSTSQVSISIQ